MFQELYRIVFIIFFQTKTACGNTVLKRLQPLLFTKSSNNAITLPHRFERKNPIAFFCLLNALHFREI